MSAGSIPPPSIVPLRPPWAGKRNAIDSNTKIEITNDVPGVQAYFTLDSTKPEPKSRTTAKYIKPFCLPPGKRIIKAIAIEKISGRESFVITKDFNVEKGPHQHHSSDDDEQDQLDFLEDVRRQEREERMAQDKAKTFMEKLNNTWLTQNQEVRHESSRMQQHNIADSYKIPIESSRDSVISEMSRNIMRTKSSSIDFFMCPGCNKRRPTDPLAGFCPECGMQLPPLPQSSPIQPGQLGACAVCHSQVPLSADFCLVCDTPLPRRPPVGHESRFPCAVCGLLNPETLSACLSCGATLPLKGRPVFTPQVAPPLPRGDEDSDYLQCSKCSRVNNPDARFCDWCGAKPSPAMPTLTCSQCGAMSHPYAQFCAGCGIGIAPPIRSHVAESRWINAGKTLAFELGNSLNGTRPNYAPNKKTMSQNGIFLKNASTNTVGLWYPSQKELIQRAKANEKSDPVFRNHSATGFHEDHNTAQRKTLLSSVSPGKGYWRQQTKHVVAHLEALAHNNLQFRTGLGPHRMGKILSGQVHEDGTQLVITLNFALRGESSQPSGKVTDTYTKLTSYLAAEREWHIDHKMGRPVSHLDRDFDGRIGGDFPDSEDDDDDYDLDDDAMVGATTNLLTNRTDTTINGGEVTNRSEFVAQLTKKRRPATATDVVKKPKHKILSSTKKQAGPPLPKVDKNLLSLLTQQGTEVDDIQACIDQGANPNAVEPISGNPALHKAVETCPDAIPVLVSHGADINAKGNGGNTALHHAASGSGRREAVDILLKLGIKLSVKNSKGETAFELASNNGFNDVANRIAVQLGKQQTSGKSLVL